MQPSAPLIRGSNGDIYGTTAHGGAYGDYGTVFQLSSNGLTALYSFCAQSGCPDGRAPSSLMQATNGDLYGTTGQGGANPAPDGFDGGTVFRLSLGLGQFVKVQPAIGVAGELVDILGTDLTGATSVTFNGAAAVFRVVSSSLIVAKVPSGATSGAIEVMTPGATLKGNVPFEVWP